MAGIKRNHNAGHCLCICALCAHRAHSKPGTQHRRCGGSLDAALRARHELLAPARKSRGKWEAV